MGLKDPDAFKTAIAGHFDESSSYLPSQADDWLREAALTVIPARHRRWRFLRDSWTFDTSASTADYAFDTIDGGDLLHFIEAMYVDGDRDLIWMGRNEADRRFQRYDTSEGEPRYWSVWGDSSDDTVRLYPTPSAVETISVRGFRKPVDFVTADSVTDMPDEFDNVIINYGVARMFLHQEVPFMYEHYMGLALSRLEELRRYYEASPLDHPMIIAGGVEGYRPKDRFLYDWEW